MPATIGAMILAAGRGERMRPLSDATPKPLLEVGGKPLIAWQIEALARAGFRDIVINAAHLADRMVSALGDGAAFGVRLTWSIEPEALETAGGIATAAPLLPSGPALIVSGDIWTAFDYATLVKRAQTMARDAASPRVHLVLVPNPSYHLEGDFMLCESSGAVAAPAGTIAGTVAADRVGLRTDAPGRPAHACRTFGNIGIYDTALFRELPRGTKLKLLPYFLRWIAAGLVSGELYRGPWVNVGTPGDLAELDAALRARAPGCATALSLR
jgi:MurNAc alpha-1-phosphate uridylyltransferase